MRPDNLETIRNLELCLKNLIEPLLAEDAYTTICDQFQDLRSFSENLKKNNVVKSQTGEKECNLKKNRYADILPFDHNRVILKDFNTSSETINDYINASWIKGIDDSFCYIAAQGPMPNTVLAFWHMIWESNADTIIMACKTEEKNKKKCHQYWPEKVGGQPMQNGFVIVKLISESQVNKSCIFRQMEVTYKNNKADIRFINQYHYVAWPDYGAPKKVDDLNCLLDVARSNHKDGPMIIHCSAGVGRTGAICALDYCWSLIENREINNDTSIVKIVENLRQQRQSMVQSADQLIFLYKSVKRIIVKEIEILKHIYENEICISEISPKQSIPKNDENAAYVMFKMSDYYVNDDVQKNTIELTKQDVSSKNDTVESVSNKNIIYSLPNKVDNSKKTINFGDSASDDSSNKNKNCDYKNIDMPKNSPPKNGLEPSCSIPMEKLDEEILNEPIYADIDSNAPDDLDIENINESKASTILNGFNKFGHLFSKNINKFIGQINNSENTCPITENIERIEPVTIIAIGQKIDISFMKTVGKPSGPVKMPVEFN